MHNCGDLCFGRSMRPCKVGFQGDASTAVPLDRMQPCCNPYHTAPLKNTIRHNLLLPSQLSVSPAWLHGVLQALLAGVGRMEVRESGVMTMTTVFTLQHWRGSSLFRL
ncbi:hypothetical protein GOODEAATRI_031716 [Goodea atripinnis]|uniref:Uncharacterized protein n=1 Tax=Goodea atripinnis TaxID=208336 RepID=A0ABV0MWS9_9TELE